MIKFKTIQFKNIGSFGNYVTTINFTETASTLVIGQNGSGKSFALLDAINIALYGCAFREINKPQIQNTKNAAGWWVQLDFDVNEVNYRIIRSSGQPSLFQIYCNGVLRNQDSKSPDYQKYLEESILKINQKSFSQIVVLGSSTYTSFMKLRPGDRRSVIEDLLEMKTFSAMNERLKDRSAQFKLEWTNLIQKISTQQEKIELQTKHLSQLNSSKDKIIEENRRKIADHSADAVAHYEQKEALETELDDLVKSLPNRGELNKSMDEIKKIETELRTELKRISVDLNFFEKNQTCYTCTQPIALTTKDSQVIKLKEKETELTEMMSGTSAAMGEIKAAIADIDAKMRKVSDLHTKIQEKNSLFLASERFVSKLETEIEQLSGNTEDIEECRKHLEKFKNELSEMEAKRDSFTEDRYCLDFASTLLKDTGIKAKLIKKYVPIINKTLNGFLASMDFDVNFEINENFVEVIKSRKRDTFTYSSFSEGEKLRIDIALLLTWREISKMRNSVSTNLLILDEVMDRSMDDEGNEEVLKLLDTLSKTCNIFVISHKGHSLLDKFDRVLKFIKKQDFSYIQEENV